MARATPSSSSRITCSATRSVRERRVTGRRMSTCGMSCSGPILACGREVQPPISSTGAPGEHGVGDRRHRVGDAGAGGDHGDAELARELGMGVRHVDGRTLVADVDDADAEPRDVVPDRLDVPALQAEDAVDAARLQEARDPGRTGVLVGVEVLAAVASRPPTLVS